MSEQTLEFESERSFHKLYGEDPENLRIIENSLGLRVVARGNILMMEGEERKSVNAKSFLNF